MSADGFSLDDKRQPIENNNLPDIIERFHNLDGEVTRNRTDRSFLIYRSEIEEKEFDLSINRYKEITYSAVEYEKPADILKNVAVLEDEIVCGVEELRGLLG
jgi:type I restriction enzyme M protein